MNAWLLGSGMLVVVTVIYLAIAVTYMQGQRIGMFVTFIGYAIANLGLIVDAINWGSK